LEEFFWDEMGGESHVFIAFHWGLKVQVFDIGAAILGIGGGEDTVP
jgi:hypothetical protein